MAEGVVGQEEYFWNTFPWVMSGNSSGGSAEETSLGDKNHSQMKQSEKEDMLDGSSARDQEVGGGSNKNDDLNKTEVSLHKAKNKVAPSDYELHVLTERERREKMKNMYHQLHALLPHLPPKTDRFTIVDGAIDYIETLQQTLQRLEKKKLERLYGPSTKITTGNTRESFMADHGSATSTIRKVSPSSSTSSSLPLTSPTNFQTWVSSNVILNVCGIDAHISICAAHKPGLLTEVCLVLEKHKLELVSANISSDEIESKSLFMIHVQANTCDQLMETFQYDEIYKKAASEITQLVNSK